MSSDGGEENIDIQHVGQYHRNGGSQDYVIPLVKKLTAEGKQVIVFRETKSETRGVAKYLAETLLLPPATGALGRLPDSDPSIASQELRTTLGGGVAFHNADLDLEERQVIEEEYRKPDTSLRVIVATTTLAMGVNTPASAVVLVGLSHPGNKPYSIAEYKNLAGRAGRLGFAERGTSYLLALEHREEHEYWSRYIEGTPEGLESRFLDESTDPRTLILRVLVAARRLSPDGVSAADVLDFLESSFGSYQRRHASDAWIWDRDSFEFALSDMRNHELIDQDEEENLHLTELGELAGEGGAEVLSVIRLVDCLRGTQTSGITDPTLIVAAQVTLEMDQVYIPINKEKHTEGTFCLAR